MKRTCSYIILIVALSVFIPQKVSAQMIAVKTDVVKDLLMTPSLGVDLVVGERTTLGAEVAFNNQPWKQDIKLVNVMPEFRFWFNGRPFTRQYVGLVGNFSIYDVAFEHVYNGDALGLGLSFGHAWTLTKRISIDFSGSVGVIGYKQMYHKKDELLEGNGIVANSRGHMLMPIKLGVSLVYVIK